IWDATAGKTIAGKWTTLACSVTSLAKSIWCLSMKWGSPKSACVLILQRTTRPVMYEWQNHTGHGGGLINVDTCCSGSLAGSCGITDVGYGYPIVGHGYQGRGHG